MNPDYITLASEKIPYIAVAICRTSFGNTHTGVAYRHSDGKVRLFHQAWHHDTKDEPISTGSDALNGPIFCVIPDIEEDRARAIAGFWEFIASRGEQIGYALRDDPDALFDPVTGLLTTTALR